MRAQIEAYGSRFPLNTLYSKQGRNFWMRQIFPNQNCFEQKTRVLVLPTKAGASIIVKLSFSVTPLNTVQLLNNRMILSSDKNSSNSTIHFELFSVSICTKTKFFSYLISIVVVVKVSFLFLKTQARKHYIILFIASVLQVKALQHVMRWK